jgi:hypothetical protein
MFLLSTESTTLANNLKVKAVDFVLNSEIPQTLQNKMLNMP